MKRTPLKRRTPLARAGRLRARTPRRVVRQLGHPGHLARVRTLSCAALGMSSCFGPMAAHHAGPRPGVGMKCSDLETHPFCMTHHALWHAGRGPFKGWTREMRRVWADAQIAATRAALGQP